MKPDVVGPLRWTVFCAPSCAKGGSLPEAYVLWAIQRGPRTVGRPILMLGAETRDAERATATELLRRANTRGQRGLGLRRTKGLEPQRLLAMNGKRV